MRLSKPESRERWRQIRDLWNQFDPIGVMSMSDWPRDEYEAYLGPTLRLLEHRTSVEEIQHYLTRVTLEHMGLDDSPPFTAARRRFAQRLMDWYAAHWPDTHA